MKAPVTVFPLKSHFFFFFLHLNSNLTLGLLRWGHLIQLTLQLIRFPLKSLTIQQQGDKALIAEIKISLLPSFRWVVNGEVMWGLESAAVKLSGVTSKCRYAALTPPPPPPPAFSSHWVKLLTAHSNKCFISQR